MNRISFSELKTWKDCPYKHKLVYIDGLKKFTGNEYTAFGTAMHTVCENQIMDETIDAAEVFVEEFAKELNNIENKELDEGLILEMQKQGKHLCKYVMPEVKKKFPKYEVVSVEEEILEEISDFPMKNERNFKGFIDLVLKTPDGTYHIIDWKTCSWGWRSEKKTDPITNYQLMFYKHFFSKKHNIDPSKIQTYFALLKRTAKNNNVEIFRVTSGKKKNQNSLKLLENSIKNIENKIFIKNRLSCKYCEFYKSEHCL